MPILAETSQVLGEAAIGLAVETGLAKSGDGISPGT